MDIYKLRPAHGQTQRAFYGKALVIVNKEGRWLRSYSTFVAHIDNNGKAHRLWDGWSMTTGRHIKAFLGMNKGQYEALKLEDIRPSEF